MQQFGALFRKETSTYFKSYFAYMIFFVYLFVSVGVAFYFGAYLSAQDESMYSLFYAQPIILLVLLPAITMKIWSDEYRSGTAEFLLTLPLEPAVPVLAKFTASFCLCFGMSLFLCPFVIYTTLWLHLDLGNLISDFVGLWLLMGFLCALGCLVSAFCRNVVVSYLFSMLVMALWIIFPRSDLYNTYNNFLFGEIGVSDIAYFLMFTAAFLVINGLVAEFNRSVQPYKTAKFVSFVFFMLAGVSVVYFVLMEVFTYKFDMTLSRFYTPQQETKAVIARVYKPITIDLYAAKNYIHRNNDYFYYFQQIKRFLNKYNSLSGGMIKVQVTEVEPFSPLEENILDNGLFYEANKDGIRDYLGAVVRDEEQNGIIIKQFLTQRRAFLEKDINKALIRLTRSSVAKNVGVYMEPTQNLEQFESFVLNLESDYNVVSISSDVYEIASDIQMLILINPKKLPETFIYAVDQFVMRGGKLVVFLDFYTENQAELTNLSDVQILPMLEQYYFEFENKFVDEGTLNTDFAVENRGISLNKAIAFKMGNAGMKILPFITHGDDAYIGALQTGALPSMFGQTPYANMDISTPLSEHNAVSVGEANVAVIGDVDFIEDYLWVDEKSQDRNPYSVIVKNDNVNAVRKLIDYMLENDIFNRQPIASYSNPHNIATQVDKIAFEPYSKRLQETDDEIMEKKMSLYTTSGKDADKMSAMMKVDASGQEIARLEKQMDSIVYQVRQDYSRRVNKMMLINILLLPFLFTLIMLLLAVCYERWYRRFIKGLGYEK